MTTSPGRVLSVGAVLLGALLAGCGTSASTTPRTTSSGSGTQAKNANAADKAFLAEIIPNDQLAVAMATLANTHAQRPQLKVFSARIIAADNAQITELTGLAKTLGVTPKPMKPTVMTGMESDAASLGIQMYQMGMDQVNPTTLATAKPFDRSFLTMMELDLGGAVTMSRSEAAKGTNSQLKTIAATTVTNAGFGVSQLKHWQSMWYGSGMKMKNMKGMKGMKGMSGMKGTGTTTTGMSGMGTKTTTTGMSGMGTKTTTTGMSGMGTKTTTTGMSGMGTKTTKATTKGPNRAAY